MRTSLKLALGMVIIYFSITILEATVVINELFYDPSGTDTNKEFIELYNNGTADVDLTGWQIQWGGTSYTYGIYYFPVGTYIRAGDYLLIGGDSTAIMFGVIPDLIYAFNFQNASAMGGGPTDAVRVYDLLLYHDTCLYDSPNTNNLEGDAGNPALPTELCSDVFSGYSLSRITVGVDNNLATDWEDLAAPTPTPSQVVPPPGYSNIADIRVNDSTGMPLYLDSLVTIAGIITCATQLGTSGPAYMYDNTAAIAVYDNTVTSSGIAIGDSVVVAGWIGFFSGLTEIVDEPVSGSPDVTFAIISGGHTVTPIEVTPAELNESNEAQLVRVNGATFVASGLFSSGTFNAYVETDTFVVYIDAQTNIPGTPIPISPCDLIGQLGQYDNTSPYFSGYQLIPRSTVDIIVPPQIIIDVGVDSIWHNDSFFVPLGNTFNVYAKVVNYGNQPANFSVACSLFAREGTNITPLTLLGTQLLGLNPLQSLIISYLVENTGVGEFLLKIITSLVGDMNPDNNSKAIKTMVFTLPVELIYDDGAFNGSLTLQQNDGYAMRFNPNWNGAYTVTELKVMTSYTTGNTNALVQVLDDDGIPNGTPGSVLYQSSQLMANGWNIFHINVDLPDGAFYVAYIFENANTSALRYDNNWPSGQNWKKINGNWSADPLAELDWMIRASISIGPNVWISLNPIGSTSFGPTGGRLSYLIIVGNSEVNDPVSADIWVMVTLPPPGGSFPVLGPLNDILLPPNWWTSRQRTLDIPGAAPSGTYSLDGYIGEYAPPIQLIYDEDHFNFYKAAGGEIDNLENNWFTDSGEPFEPQQNIVAYPKDFSLSQNSPNPFNASTSIEFALPQAMRVSLSVYNLNGQVVAKLIDGWREAGHHQVTFDGSGLSSGIYLCRLTAGNYTASQKMVLLK